MFQPSAMGEETDDRLLHVVGHKLRISNGSLLRYSAIRLKTRMSLWVISLASELETGSLKAGKREFLFRLNEKQMVLDAGAYADEAGLWVGNKAKVVFDQPVGVLGSDGSLTNTINVYKTNTGFVHGAPGTP